MGEKVKLLGSFYFKSKIYEIELNKPPVSGATEQVHIQSDNFRLEIDKADYIKFAISILVATSKLKKIKGME